MAEVLAVSVHDAWLQAVQTALQAAKNEVCPLVVTIQKPIDTEAWDNPVARRQVNALLKRSHRQPIENVASTIFMQSLWHESMSKENFYARYFKVLPKLRRFPQNRKGIYLERLIDYPGDQNGSGLNQLDKIIEFYKAGTRRRSAFQATPYVPAKDLSGSPYLHFPCLQQVAFIPNGQTLTTTAFYPLHYLFERAYGNYLGLVHLGSFMAKEMGLKLERVVCVAGVAKLEDSTSMVRRFLERSRAAKPDGAASASE